MLFDYTQFQSFLQIFIELSAAFLVFDKVGFLFSMQKGLTTEIRGAKQDLMDEAQNALNIRHDHIDDKWIERKGILRSAFNSCKYKNDEENEPEYTLYWNSVTPPLAVVSIILCLFLLFAFAEIKTYQASWMVNSVLLVLQFTVIPIIVLSYYYYVFNRDSHSNTIESKKHRIYYLIVIAALWEIVAIVAGSVLGFADVGFKLIEEDWIPTIMSVAVWFPVVPLCVYVWKLGQLSLKIAGNYKGLKLALDDFNAYNKGTRG